MNISYNWLKKYIAADLSAEAMATILTDIGLEVESFEKIETVRGGLQGVVVGEVLSCEKHPDSDHLHVTTVDVGAPEPLRIVCGAPNCRKGLKVLCATAGAVLYPEGGDEAFKIKRSKIRGVESLGMLCAEDELGIGASHDGIMELPADAPQTLSVTHGTAETVTLTYTAPNRCLMPKGEGTALEAAIDLPEKLEAPVTAGQTVGTVTIRNNGAEVQAYPITAAQDVDALSFGYCFRKLAQSLVTLD